MTLQITDNDKVLAESLFPNNDEEVNFDHDYELSKQILALLLTDRHFLIQSFDLIKPNYFADTSQRLICKILFDFFNQYREIPNKIYVENEIKKSSINQEQRFLHLGEYKATLVSYVPGSFSRDYLMDKICDFAKKQSVVIAVNRTLDLIKSRKDDSYMKIWDLWRSALSTDKKQDMGLDYFNTLDERYARMGEELKGKETFTSGFPGIDNYLAMKGLGRGEIGCFVGLSGAGKCFKENTQVLMYDGTIKKVEDIVVGDLVMGDDSTPRKVINLHSGVDQMYDVIPVKGEKYTVNSQHILVLKTCGKYKKPNGKIYRKYSQSEYYVGNDLVEIPVNEFLKKKKGFRSFLKGFRTGVEFKYKKVKLDPYYLGIWLGDGTCRSADITTMDHEVVSEISKLAKEKGLTICKKTAKGKASTYSLTNKDYYGDKLKCLEVCQEDNDDLLIPNNCGSKSSVSKLTEEKVCEIFKLYHEGKKPATIARQYKIAYGTVVAILKGVTWRHCENTPISGGLNRNKNELRDGLQYYNLLRNKHVPEDYKVNSRKIRLEILAGLLDSDGSLSQGGYNFINKNKNISESVVFIARSLGFAAYLSESRKKSQTGREGIYWRVSISGDCSKIPVRIERKKASVRKQIKNHLVTGIDVIPVGVGRYYGFETDGNHRFLLGDFTVVHNSIALINSAASNLANGKKVCYITLEMSQDKIAKRFDSLLTHQPFVSLLERQEIVKSAIREHVKFNEDTRQLVIKHYPGGSADINTFRAYLSQLSLYGFKPDLLCVDYVGELKDIAGLKTYESRQLLVREMRALGQEEQHCTLTAIQANRKGREAQDLDGHIDDDAMADAFGQARPMDAIWSLNKAESGSSVGYLFIIKHRDGISRQEIYYKMNQQTLLMSEIYPEEYKMTLANYRKQKASQVLPKAIEAS